MRKASILLGNRSLWIFSRFWRDKSVQHLIITDCSQCFIIKQIWTTDIIGVPSTLQCEILLNTSFWDIHWGFTSQILVFGVMAKLLAVWHVHQKAEQPPETSIRKPVFNTKLWKAAFLAKASSWNWRSVDVLYENNWIAFPGFSVWSSREYQNL